MKKLIAFLPILFFFLSSFSQVDSLPHGLPSPKSATGWPEYYFLKVDKGFINAISDTLFQPRFIGTEVLWLHAGVDTVKWIYTGAKWIKSTGGSSSGSGTLTSFSAGTLSPLFTTSVTTPNTTPILNFTQSNTSQFTVLGRIASGSGAYSFVNADSTLIQALHSEAYYNTKYSLVGALTGNVNVQSLMYGKTSSSLSSDTLYTVDTANKYMGVGIKTPANTLSVLGASTVGAFNETGIESVSANDYGIDKGGSIVFRGRSVSTANTNDMGAFFGEISARKENSSDGNGRSYMSLYTSGGEWGRANSNGQLNLKIGDYTGALLLNGSYSDFNIAAPNITSISVANTFVPDNLVDTVNAIQLNYSVTNQNTFVTSLNTLVGGSGYTDGTYPIVNLTEDVRVSMVVSGGVVTSVTLLNSFAGLGIVGDVLGFSTINPIGAGTGFSIKVATVGTSPSLVSNALRIYRGNIQVDSGSLYLRTMVAGNAGTDSVVVKDATGKLKTISPTYYGTGTGGGTVTLVSGTTNQIDVATGSSTPVVSLHSGGTLPGAWALGTPASMTATNVTGLPVITGISGLGTGVATALGVNIGSAGAFVTFNGAGGTPSSMTGTNITGIPNAGLTNSTITINGTSVSLGGTRTLSLASSDFPNQGTTTTVLHGNAAGNPSFTAIQQGDVAGGGFVDLTSAQTAAGNKTWTGNNTTFNSATNFFRTTNGGSNVNAAAMIDMSGSNSIAGSTAVGFEPTNGESFTVANGTRRKSVGFINIANLTSTAGSEAGDLVFGTGSAGAAPTTKLTITSGGNMTLANGNFTLGTAGNALLITEGSNGRVGQTTLVSGTKAITITGLTTSSRAFVSLVTQGGTSTTTYEYNGVCTSNTLTINAITTAGATVTTDTSVINYFVIN